MSMWTQTRHADSTIQTRCQNSSQMIPPACKSQTRAVSWFVNCISGEHLHRNQFVFLVRNKYTNIFCSSDMWGNYIFMFWNIRKVVKHRGGEWHKSFRLQASCQRKSTNMNRANISDSERLKTLHGKVAELYPPGYLNIIGTLWYLRHWLNVLKCSVYIAQVIQKAVKALVRESNTVCNWLTFLNLQN